MPNLKYLYLLPAAAMLVAFISVFFLAQGDISGITGKFASRVFVTSTSESTCPIHLVPGWNLFSVYCEAENMSIEHIFNSTGTNLTLYAYDPTDANDTWKVYRGDLPEWVVLDLGELSTKKGYWIIAPDEINLTLNGTMDIPNFIELSSGWNLVGFPLDINQSIQEAIGDSAPNLLAIHKYEPLSPDPWKVYSALLPENDLEVLEPNYGYWISMNGSALWIIDN